jgi:hypothetical protein
MSLRNPWSILALTAVVMTAAGGHHAVTRPPVYNTIPNYGYQYRTRSPSAFTLSLPAVPVPLRAVVTEAKATEATKTTASAAAQTAADTATNAAAAPATTQVVTRGSMANSLLFQFKPDQLKIEHCEIHSLAVQIYNDGEKSCAVLSLKATQNAAMDPDKVAVEGAKVSADSKKFTLPIKRNQFVVTVRAYAAVPIGAKSADEPPGKPELLEFGPTEFWVQRGEPMDLRKKIQDSRIPQYFEAIDRLELEFFYR